MRIFKDNGIFATGKILPHTELRLFLDMKEKKIDPIAKARLLEKAEIALSEPIPVLLLSDYRSYFLTGSRAPFDPRYQRRRTMMVELAMGEYFSQSGRYLEKLCDVIFAILEESSWVLPAHTGHSPECPKTEIPEVYRPDQLHGIDLRSAATATMLAGVYYLVKDRLDTVSPIIAKRMQWETLDRTVRPYLQHEFHWSGAFGGLVNNWCTYCVQAILFCTAILEEDAERRTAVATRAMRHLDNYIAACPPAGGCDEGPGYWEGAAGALFTALEILYDMSGGAIDLLSHPFVAALGAYEPNMYIWGSRFANFADCGPNIFLNTKRLYRYGRRSGVPSLSELARLITAEKLTVPQGRDFFDYAVFYTFLKDLYEEVPTDTAEIRLPRSAWQEDLRIAVFREREDGKGLYFAIKGGHNNESHNHNDVGSFLLYKDGRPVLIDAGSGSYTKKTFSPERYTIWNMSSAYHNLPMIGGYAQKNGAQYKSSEEQFDEEGRRVSMELATAYPKEAPLRSFVRACGMQGARVTVADTLLLSEPSEVQFRFLTTEQPTQLRPGRVSLPEGMVLSFDPSLSLEITEVQTQDYDPKGAFGEDTLWQIRLSGIADEKSYTFIIE